MIDLELYRVFYCTARTGSLSKAAQELFITQPAVTHAIRQLEEKLGERLFIRTSKGVRLTREGEALFPYVEQAYHLLRAGERKIAELQNLLTGELKLSAGDALCRHYLLPHLEAFHERHPDIRIRVTNRTTPETIQLLKDGRVDLGIVDLPVADEQLEIREGPVLHDIFVAGEKYRHLAGTPVALAELVRYPLLMLERTSNTRRYIEECAAKRGVNIAPDIELGSIDLLIAFARAGLGVASVVREFAPAELDGRTLFEIRLDEPLPARRIGIATLKGVPLSPAIRRFIRQLLPEMPGEGG